MRTYSIIPAAVRLYAKVDKNGPTMPGMTTQCHVWTGALKPGKNGCPGYGKITVDGRTVATHRLAWELARGVTLPEDVHVLHRCDNPPCLRVDHLFEGTKRSNAIDSAAKGRNPSQRYRHRIPRGERSPLAKFSDQVIEQIRTRALAGEPRRLLAVEFGCSYAYVGDLVRGKARLPI